MCRRQRTTTEGPRRPRECSNARWLVSKMRLETSGHDNARSSPRNGSLELVEALQLSPLRVASDREVVQARTPSIELDRRSSEAAHLRGRSVACDPAYDVHRNGLVVRLRPNDRERVARVPVNPPLTLSSERPVSHGQERVVTSAQLLVGEVRPEPLSLSL